MADLQLVYLNGSSSSGWNPYCGPCMTPSLDSGAIYGLDGLLWGGVSRVGVPGAPGGQLTSTEVKKLIDILMGRLPPGTALTVGGVRVMFVSVATGDRVSFTSTGKLFLAAAASRQAVEVFAAGLVAGSTLAQASDAAMKCRNRLVSMAF